MKKKIMKKKEKIKTNILNFSNPYSGKFISTAMGGGINQNYKVQLETSAHQNPSFISMFKFNFFFRKISR
jgi:hypothetical protein